MKTSAASFVDVMTQVVRVMLLRPQHLMRKNRGSIALCGTSHKMVLAYAILISAEDRFFTRAELSAISGISPELAMDSLYQWARDGVCHVDKVMLTPLSAARQRYVYQVRVVPKVLNAMPRMRNTTPMERVFCPVLKIPLHPTVRDARTKVMRQGAIDRAKLSEKSRAGVEERIRLVATIRRLYPNAHMKTMLAACGVPSGMWRGAVYVRRVGGKVVQAGGAA